MYIYIFIYIYICIWIVPCCARNGLAEATLASTPLRGATCHDNSVFPMQALAGIQHNLFHCTSYVVAQT